MAYFNGFETLLAGLKGEDGKDGNKIRYGPENPSTFEEWVQGDIFINTTTNVIYSFNGSTLEKIASLGGEVSALTEDDINQLLN